MARLLKPFQVKRKVEELGVHERPKKKMKFDDFSAKPVISQTIESVAPEPRKPASPSKPASPPKPVAKKRVMPVNDTPKDKPRDNRPVPQGVCPPHAYPPRPIPHPMQQSYPVSYPHASYPPGLYYPPPPPMMNQFPPLQPFMPVQTAYPVPVQPMPPQQNAYPPLPVPQAQPLSTERVTVDLTTPVSNLSAVGNSINKAVSALESKYLGVTPMTQVNAPNMYPRMVGSIFQPMFQAQVAQNFINQQWMQHSFAGYMQQQWLPTPQSGTAVPQMTVPQKEFRTTFHYGGRIFHVGNKNPKLTIEKELSVYVYFQKTIYLLQIQVPDAEVSYKVSAVKRKKKFRAVASLNFHRQKKTPFPLKLTYRKSGKTMEQTIIIQ